MSMKDEVAAGVHQLVLSTPKLLLLIFKWRQLLRSTCAARTKAFVVDEAHSIEVVSYFFLWLTVLTCTNLFRGTPSVHTEKDWESSEFIA